MVKMMWNIIDCSKFKYRTFQYLAVIGANMGIVSIGMHHGWTSSALPILTSGNTTFNMTTSQETCLIAMMMLGSLIGDILAAVMAHKIGHCKLITLTSIPLFISWILIALAPSKAYLFAGRLIAGIASGVLLTALPPYLSEISEAEIRGYMVSTCLMALVLGTLLVISISLFATPTAVAYVASVTSLLMLPIMHCLPESAYFYLMHKNVLTAKASLQKFLGKGEVVEELYRISRGVMEEGSDGGSLMDIFRNENHRKTFFIALLVTVTHCFSGMLSFHLYSWKMFEEESGVTNVIYFGVYFVIVLVSQQFVDIAGRKPLLLLSTGMVCLLLTLKGSYIYIEASAAADKISYNFIQSVLALALIISYGLGLYFVPMTIVSEIFPSHIKTLGFCIVNITSVLLTAGMWQIFEWTNGSNIMFVPFYCFACYCAVAMVFVVHFVPETKKKTLEIIQSEIRGNSNENFTTK